ncbi:RNA-directed DNA polymerase, eukaryota, reverse transcriptase zinc-binding domain protein [Tanacetum coccineum]
MSGNLMGPFCRDGIASSKLNVTCQKMASGEVILGKKVDRSDQRVESMSLFDDLDFFLTPQRLNRSHYLRNDFKDVQMKIDRDPDNKELRKKEVVSGAINDEEGNRFERRDVTKQFVKHFQKFLGVNVPVDRINNIEALIKCKLTEEEANFMVTELNDEEIKLAMFQIDDNKTHGLYLFKGYDRKNGPKRVVMKVDIQKAYDIVNWQFLEDILVGFGFHSKMVNWIMKCVSTTSFSIYINGECCGYFIRGRCLRQGDPMSPYLFTLVMEILTLIMKEKVEQDRKFQFHFECKKLQLTHVCFVDDLLMFCHVDRALVSVLKEAIEVFAKVARDGGYGGGGAGGRKSLMRKRRSIIIKATAKGGRDVGYVKVVVYVYKDMEWKR